MRGLSGPSPSVATSSYFHPRAELGSMTNNRVLVGGWTDSLSWPFWASINRPHREREVGAHDFQFSTGKGSWEARDIRLCFCPQYSVFPFTFPLIHSFTHPSIHAHLSIHPSFYLTTNLLFHSANNSLSIQPSTYPFFHLPISLFSIHLHPYPIHSFILFSTPSPIYLSFQHRIIQDLFGTNLCRGLKMLNKSFNIFPSAFVIWWKVHNKKYYFAGYQAWVWYRIRIWALPLLTLWP